MKFRNGFVTNSSSSSYVCEICGTSEGGYDYSLEDVDMYECENGHTFWRYHIGENEDFYENALKYIRKKYPDMQLKALMLLPEAKNANKEFIPKIFNILGKDEDDISDYEYPSALCPICNKTFIKDEELLSYASKKYDFSIADIQEEILNNFYKE